VTEPDLGIDRALALLDWGATGWGDEIVLGTLVTIALALSALPLGLVLGLAAAIARRSSYTIISDLSISFTTVFRALPELLTVFLIFYGGQALLSKVSELTGLGYIELSPFLAGMIALGLVFAAFASEVFTSAFTAIPAGQRESAMALGLSPAKSFWLVVAPQLLRHALPGLSNLWLILLKDTSLISVIALNDLMRVSRVAASSESSPVFFYLIALLIYLGLSMLSSIGIGKTRSWAERGLEAGR